MNLSEYMEQETPRRMPKVILQPSEVQLYHRGKIPNGSLQEIAILHPDIPFRYTLVNDGCLLWTVDKFGNPKAPSCFWLNKHQYNGTENKIC